jgi:gliding motility-associated-like protein
MLNRLRHIIVFAALLFTTLVTSGQSSMPDTVCVGATKTYSVNTPAVPSTYTWKINGVTQATTTNSITVNWNTPGTFLVTVQELSASGCYGNIQSGYVYVNALPLLVINNPAPICPGSTTDLTLPAITAGSDPGLTFGYWTDAAGTNPLPNPNSVGTPGTYYISAVNSNGCRTIAPVTITPKPLLSATLTGGGTICAGSSRTLTITFTGTAPFNFTYTDGTNSNTINNINTSSYQFTVSPVVSTTYTVTGIGDAGCVTATNNLSELVAVVQILQSMRYPDVTAMANVPVQLQARNLGAGYTYLWKPPVGLNNYTIYNPVFNYNQQTEYTIAISSIFGCNAVDTLLVKMAVQAPPIVEDIFVPKAWSPNNDGHNDRLFPLTENIKEIRYFRIFNRWGQMVFESNTIGQGWDGIYKGKPQVMDTYTWTAEAVGISGKIIKRAGNSVLLR